MCCDDDVGFFLRARVATTADAERVMQQFHVALDRLNEMQDRAFDSRARDERPCANRRRELAADYRDLEGMIPWGTADERCKGCRTLMYCLWDCMPLVSNVAELFVSDREVRLRDPLGVHERSWDGLANWLKAKGADAAAWISEDRIDPWAAVPLEG